MNLYESIALDFLCPREMKKKVIIYTSLRGIRLLEEAVYKDYLNQILNCMNREILIKRIYKGRNKGQFRFVLKADNYLILSSSESYYNIKDIEDIASKYFPNFKVVIQDRKF